MELILSFIAGFVLAGVTAFLLFRYMHSEAVESERKRYEQALETMKEQVQNTTNQMLKERQAELQRCSWLWLPMHRYGARR